MSAAVHIVLLHAADVMEKLKIPMGELSEEAHESRNKDFKHMRTFNTRKMSLEVCNSDCLKGLLTASDPIVASTNYYQKRSTSNIKDITIRSDVRELLAAPKDPEDVMYMSDDSDDE